ncbi:aspartate racemase [Tumebacillus sp. BK434]|uniref:aspartate/glutamate racemase family protein n=1 Tax=Tumebacillus sp. BK434 TaxID=2512169 RepID=UPI00105118FA|nr:aspartate/glutamate racemase family protein [Tumebacillus sp. BK434]TCP54499.1 aspartate racemase [Tumebacillus sp. BK434]
MKTIGMLGGMSWESSLEYYRLINKMVKEQLGGFHNAKSVMHTVDFAEIERYQREGNWEQATRVLVEAAQSVERGGADLLIICTNTMHKMADDVQAAVSIPLLHIADATAEAIQAQGLKKVGLLATIYTMEQDFYTGRLQQHGLEVLIPNAEPRQEVNRIIYEELCQGQILESSHHFYKQLIDDLTRRGADGVILGCTEIGLLIKQGDVSVPLFDTASLHAAKAVQSALE